MIVMGAISSTTRVTTNVGHYYTLLVVLGGGGEDSCQLRNHIQAKHIDPTEKKTRSGQEGLFAKQNKVEFFFNQGKAKIHRSKWGGRFITYILKIGNHIYNLNLQWRLWL